MYVPQAIHLRPCLFCTPPPLASDPRGVATPAREQIFVQCAAAATPSGHPACRSGAKFTVQTQGCLTHHTCSDFSLARQQVSDWTALSSPPTSLHPVCAPLYDDDIIFKPVCPGCCFSEGSMSQADAMKHLEERQAAFDISDIWRAKRRPQTCMFGSAPPPLLVVPVQ